MLLLILFFNTWFSFQTGQIFVFRGMLNLIENRDQLAVILGHEIAHVVLNHGVRQLHIVMLWQVLSVSDDLKVK